MIDINLIERFFEHELTEDELKQFSHRLDTNKQFEAMVNRYEFARQTATSIYMPEQEQVKKELSAHWKNLDQPVAKQRKIIPFSRKLIAIAASFLGLLVACVWWFQPLQPAPNLSALLAEQTSLMENFDSAERGDPNTLQMLQAYEGKQYQEVLTYTNDLNYSDLETHLIRGRAFIQLKQFEAAIPLFEQVIQEKHTKQDEAIWNLALIYFELNEIDKAKDYLQLIINQEFASKTKAQEILRILS